jgi:hypothetical protein
MVAPGPVTVTGPSLIVPFMFMNVFGPLQSNPPSGLSEHVIVEMDMEIVSCTKRKKHLPDDACYDEFFF